MSAAKTMPCLTIWQPHAALIVNAGRSLGRPYKRYETRSRDISERLIGQRIGIHAGRRMDDVFALCNCGDWSGETAKAFITALEDCGLEWNSPAFFPSGCIVGSAVILECWPAEQVAHLGAPFGDFSAGRFAIELAYAKPLRKGPVPWRGQQGFFNVPTEVFYG